MHITTPWSLPQKEPSKKSHNVPHPWKDSPRSEMSRRAGHDEAYVWDSIPEMAGEMAKENNLSIPSDVSIEKSENNITIIFSVPNLDKSQLGLAHVGDILIVRSAKPKDQSEKAHEYFACNIELDEKVNWNGADARLEDQSITIKLPRKR